jgi:hypothetical protein
MLEEDGLGGWEEECVVVLLHLCSGVAILLGALLGLSLAVFCCANC